MHTVGDVFNFSAQFKVEGMVVENISDTALIAQGKDGSLYAIHFFADEAEARKMKKEFASFQSFSIVQGYILGQVDNKWVLAAPLPRSKSWGKWLITNSLPPWRRVVHPFVVIPEEAKLLIRNISEAIYSIHRKKRCHGNILKSLMIGSDNTVFLIPNSRNETDARIQDDLDDYEEVINDIFKVIPGGDHRDKFQEEIFGELCALSGYFVEKKAPRTKWSFSKLLLTCPLDWSGTQRYAFMSILSVVKHSSMNKFNNIFAMNSSPAKLLHWRNRLPGIGDSDATPLLDVYSFMGAPKEYKSRTGFVEYRKNLESHARDYEVGITGHRVEDMFFWRWPDLVFKLYYIIVLEICTGPMPGHQLLRALDP